MAQPKAPPISLRIPAATRDRVEKWATAKGIARNAAYVELIDRGLAATGQSAALAGVAKADAPGLRGALKAGDRITGNHGLGPSAAIIRRVATEPKFTGVTASGEPLPARKPYQKVGKK